jgi:hypothetical protein
MREVFDGSDPRLEAVGGVTNERRRLKAALLL